MKPRDEAAAGAAETASSVEKAPKDDGKRTPEGWRAHAFPTSGRGNKRQHPSLWQHAAAGALHGWAEHEHHAGAPMRLSGEDYFAALVAASEPVKGDYRPHPGALSPHARAGKG